MLQTLYVVVKVRLRPFTQHLIYIMKDREGKCKDVDLSMSPLLVMSEQHLFGFFQNIRIYFGGKCNADGKAADVQSKGLLFH